MSLALKVENLSKAYHIGVIGTGTLSNDLKRWYARSRGKEDPFLKIGEINDRTTKSNSDIVWSLKDISFEIRRGDAVGIIGKNGAGKSTLLKILSRVTSPTTGKITGNGRIASLLEVGTGFHPELTGRDNIYLNGAILGMRKKEIKRKFDEIVDFSGVQRYIDTPVKRYSSGMYVRLAFAVAAYLESEILIVDEVLAVGDAEFQKKCLGKMGEVSKGEGRTVLFVSHNMNAIASITNVSLLLKQGLIYYYGDTSAAIEKYLSKETSSQIYQNEYSNKSVYINKIIVSSEGYIHNEGIAFELYIKSNQKIENVILGVGIYNQYDESIANRIIEKALNLDAGINFFRIQISKHNLMPGEYKLAIAIAEFRTYEFYDVVIGEPVFKLHNDKEDSILIAKWNKNLGYHTLPDINIIRS